MSNQEIEARIEQGQTATHQDEGLADFAVSDAGTLQSHLNVYLQLRQQAKELAGMLKDAERGEREAEQELIKAMTEQGLDSFKALGMHVSKTEKVSPSVLVENRPKQMAWLREIGCGHLIQETVHSATFGAFIRNDILGAGKPVPEFVALFREHKISLRGAR